MYNLPRRKLAEYFLDDITSLETILDVVQGESFQRGDIILNERHSSSLPGKRKGEVPYLQVDNICKNLRRYAKLREATRSLLITIDQSAVANRLAVLLRG